MFVTQTWIYCTINDENEMNKFAGDHVVALKAIRSKYFKTKQKNHEKLFKILDKEHHLLISLYNDDEIFQIYNNIKYMVKKFD